MDYIPFFSIVMPTYNSEQTIEIALKSIEMQNIEKKEVEILVVDGGSSDKTIEIAKAYGAKILENPNRLPEYAKLIGMKNAIGRYIIRMDSDEELLRIDQLKKRKKFLESNVQVKAILANRLVEAPKQGLVSKYLNLYGDPFSYYIYKTKDDKITSFKGNIISKSDGYIMKFDDNDIYPIGDAGTTTLSLEYMKSEFMNQIEDIDFACTAFDAVVRKTKFCGVIPEDDVRHYSKADLKTYLSKLRFRVINNLFNKKESGFSMREEYSEILGRRKKKFILYTLSFVFPMIDSIYLGIKNRNFGCFLHFVYLYYTCFYTVYCLVLNKAGKKLSNKSYGK